jgi:hypothetical protein
MQAARDNEGNTIPEDDALDALHAYIAPESRDGHVRQALATVREALERLREKSDRQGMNIQALYKQKRENEKRAESAEAEVRRLTLERDTARRERNEAGDEAAVLRDTVRRLTEGLLEAEMIDRSHGFTLPGDSALYVFLWGIEQNRAASPSDGGGAK